MFSRSDYRKMKLEKVLEENLTNLELQTMIYDSDDDEEKEKLAEKLLQQKISNSELRFLIRNVDSKRIKEAASQRLLDFFPSERDIKNVAYFGYGITKQIAQEVLDSKRK